MYLFLSLHFILVTGFKPEFKFHHNNLLFTSFAFSSSLNWLSVEHKLRRRNVNILDDGERSLSYSLLPYALQSWLQKKMLNFPWQYQLFVAANWKLLLPIWFSKKEVTGHCRHRPSKTTWKDFREEIWSKVLYALGKTGRTEIFSQYFMSPISCIFSHLEKH